jgi:hypothetical protein
MPLALKLAASAAKSFDVHDRVAVGVALRGENPFAISHSYWKREEAIRG